MPDPSPALVDTIARAICDSDPEGGYVGWWDDFVDDPASWRSFESYRKQARAALAAMPQPVGYAVLATDEDPYGLNRRRVITCPDRRSAERVEARRAEAGWDTTVVALVPVEDQ